MYRKFLVKKKNAVLRSLENKKTNLKNRQININYSNN